jgi:hypothetical protein
MRFGYVFLPMTEETEVAMIFELAIEGENK